MARPWLATDKVRFVGEPVAAVLTEHAYQGQDAADLVEVDYDPLPAVVDLRAAARRRGAAVPARPAPTRPAASALRRGVRRAPVRRLRGRRHPGDRQPAAGRGAAGDPGRRRGLGRGRAGHAVVLHPERRRAPATRWPAGSASTPAQVHVITPDVGGGFGAKIGADPEFALVAWLARHVGRPVRWTETRSENMTGMLQGRAQLQTVTIGGNRDGDVLAYRLDVLADAGAYPRLGAFLPMLHPDDGPGRLRHPEGRVPGPGGGHHHHLDRGLPRRRPTGGHRGDRAGDGPVRRRDRHGPGRGAPAQPGRRRTSSRSRTKGGARLRHRRVRRGARPGAGGRRATPSCGPSRPPAASAATRCSSGIGVSVFVEITGGGAFAEDAAVEVHAGRHGHRAHRHLAARPGPRHGVGDARQRAPRHPDREDHRQARRHRPDPARRGTMGSRSLQTGGVAVYQAAGELVELAKQRAADLLEAERGRPRGRRRRGRGARAPTPAITLAQLAERGAAAGGQHVRQRGADVPVRRAPRRRRGRRRVRQGRGRPDRHRRRRRPGAQPAARARASGTAASPRASRRRCWRRSSTTPTATR